MHDLELTMLARRVDRLMAPWDRKDGPGMVVGVVRGGTLVLHRQVGMASLELGIPLGPDSVFRIASVSKQFTCAIILMLAAEGRLDVQDAVRKYIPELPDYGHPLTVAHLMHNTSGIRDMLEVMRLGGADLTYACTRRGFAGRDMPPAQPEFRARHPLSVQQQQLLPAGRDCRAHHRRDAAQPCSNA